MNDTPKDDPESDPPRFVQMGRSHADDPTLAEQALIDALDGLSYDSFRVVVTEAVSKRSMWAEFATWGVEPPPEPPIKP